MPDLIELSQVWIANWAIGLVAWLPLGYAFGAGMVSTINPCGFAMLPAYLSLYLGTSENRFQENSLLLRIGNAYFIGLMVTLGFVVLFGAVGVVISAGGQFVIGIMPWAGLLTGIALILVGVLILAGRHIYSSSAAKLAARINTTGSGGPKTFFLFGVAYAVASLACTLPVFLVVVGSAIAVNGIISGVIQFISYSLGMGIVLLALTLSIAVFKGAAMKPFRAVLPYVNRASAVLVLLMGVYLVYYWLVKGGLLSTFRL